MTDHVVARQHRTIVRERGRRRGGDRPRKIRVDTVKSPIGDQAMNIIRPRPGLLEFGEDRGASGTRRRDGVSGFARVHWSVRCGPKQQRRVLTLALSSRARDGFDIRDRGAVGSGTDINQFSV